MTTRTRRRAKAAVESGATDTQMTTEVRDAEGNLVEFPATEAPEGEERVTTMVTPMPDAPAPWQAKLTADELNEVRRRNDAVDHANAEAKRIAETIDTLTRERAHMLALAAAGQRDIVVAIRDLIVAHGVDRGLRYRIDMDSAQLIAVGPVEPNQ